jgi:hypothetical protein
MNVEIEAEERAIPRKGIHKGDFSCSVACWAMGTKELKECTGRKKIFCTWPTRAAKAEKNLLYQQDMPNEPTKIGPLTFITL